LEGERAQMEDAMATSGSSSAKGPGAHMTKLYRAHMTKLYRAHNLIYAETLQSSHDETLHHRCSHDETLQSSHRGGRTKPLWPFFARLDVPSARCERRGAPQCNHECNPRLGRVPFMLLLGSSSTTCWVMVCFSRLRAVHNATLKH
jgi:hypothetical protein